MQETVDLVMQETVGPAALKTKDPAARGKLKIRPRASTPAIT